jgi:hypothetical protein
VGRKGRQGRFPVHAAGAALLPFPWRWERQSSAVVAVQNFPMTEGVWRLAENMSLFPFD